MFLSTAIKIVTEFSAEITNPVITIYNPAGVILINAIAMTHVSGNSYQYIFQSSSTYASGRYSVVIRATSGVYTIADRDEFTLNNY